jgi:hypothetical protein
MPEPWSDTVWVFVDYNKDGVMKRLSSELGGTLSTHTATAHSESLNGGTVRLEPNNIKGMWVIGDARTNTAGSFSATVEMYTSEKNLAGACAYGSSYPPVGEWVSPIKVNFTGTPIYEITLKDLGGETLTVKSNSTFLQPCDYTIDSFTDATGAPSKFIKCMPMTIGISAPDNIPVDISTTFTPIESFSALSAATTYTWSAPDFDPPSGTEASYVAMPPSNIEGTYVVTLKVQSPGYCDRETSKTVTVVDCVNDPSATIHNLTVSSTTYCAGGKVTFALDGTTAGRHYQLYEQGRKVMELLEGTGFAATFAGTMEGGHYAGIYEAHMVYESGKCDAFMNNVPRVDEFQLPDNPIGIDGASCKPAAGSVPVTISASSSYATITWYGTDTDDSVLWTGETFTPTISNSTTYYAQAQMIASGCILAERTPVLAVLKTPPSGPDGLTSDKSKICNGMPTPVTLTANDYYLGAGAVFEWGTGSVAGVNLIEETAGNTWSVSPDAATTYWVRLRGTGACSEFTTEGKFVSIGTYTAVSPGAIISGSTSTVAGTDPNVTIGSDAPATGGSGSYTYQWVRTKTKGGTPAAHANTQATYTIVEADFNTAGTYRFTRRVKDAVCTNTSYVTAANNYTLYIAPATTYCELCCWNGPASYAGTNTWVSCTVTAQPYPFHNSATPTITGVTWLDGTYTHHYPGAAATYSDVDGRRNTDVILLDASASVSAAQVCRDLGADWYLPAFEELINMSAGTFVGSTVTAGVSSTYSYLPMNSLSGAKLLAPPPPESPGTIAYYWSSTEENSHGRRGRVTGLHNDQAILIGHNGGVYSATKRYGYRVYCVRRP